ncbi:MAG: response regulator [Desulfovibrio sp.]|nr:response regulator [Desulfovibrio sp.]
MRVLFVDDETEFLELMKKRLVRRSFSVDTASDGESALRLLDETLNSGESFDAVVLDVRMPGTDGLEVLRQMKERRPALPVILLTGHASMGVAMQGLDLGAYDYMLKPVGINELIIKISEAARMAA